MSSTALLGDRPESPEVDVDSEFRVIAVSSIAPSRTNPRKTRDPGKLNELAESIRAHGIIQPIVVRATNPAVPVAAKYEIVAGERRWAAAKIAGLEVVPVRVRNLTDQQVVEIQVIENLQREDVHPLEEAAGFEALIRDYAYSASAIAEKIGCHESYVHKRLRLARLIEPAREAFAAGDISLNHAILLARLDSVELQKQGFELCFEDDYDHITQKRSKIAVPAKSLDLRIREQIFLDLSSAPWNKHDPDLVTKAGACLQCRKRTGAHGMLFDDEDDMKKRRDHCLDRECFETKRQAVVQITTREIAEKTGEEPARVVTGWCDDRQLKKLGAIREFSYRTIKNKNDRCEHAEKAVVVYGSQTGHTIEICRESTCKKHNRHSFSSLRRTGAEEAAERRRKTEARIDGAWKRELWLRTWNAVKELETERKDWDVVAKCLIERIGNDSRRELLHVLKLQPAKKQFGNDNQTPLEKYYKALPDDQALSFLVALSMSWSLLGWGGKVKDLEKYARELKLDPAAIRKEIAAPILAKAKKAAVNEKAKKRAEAADQKKGVKVRAVPAAAGDGPEIEDADPDQYDTDFGADGEQ